MNWLAFAGVVILILLVSCLLLPEVLVRAVVGPFLANPPVPPPVETARARITPGKERAEAITTLADAWYHANCGQGYDLFFYGPHDPATVQIVLLRSESTNSKTVVSFVGPLDNHLLPLYAYCVPPALFRGPATAPS